MPHVCDICKHSFNRKSNYYRHKKEVKCIPLGEGWMITRAGERVRAVYCPYCGKAFTSRQSMLRHIRTSCKSNLAPRNQVATPIIEPEPTPIPQQDTKPSPTPSTPSERGYNFVYLLKEIISRTGTPYYKIGKTTRKLDKRLQEYSKGSELLVGLRVRDCHVTENILKTVLNKDEKVTKCDFGTEYFECDDEEYLIDVIIEVARKNK
jgi:hypothetical protein